MALTATQITLTLGMRRHGRQGQEKHKVSEETERVGHQQQIYSDQEARHDSGKTNHA